MTAPDRPALLKRLSAEHDSAFVACRDAEALRDGIAVQLDDAIAKAVAARLRLTRAEGEIEALCRGGEAGLNGAAAAPEPLPPARLWHCPECRAAAHCFDGATESCAFCRIALVPGQPPRQTPEPLPPVTADEDASLCPVSYRHFPHDLCDGRPDAPLFGVEAKEGATLPRIMHCPKCLARYEIDLPAHLEVLHVCPKCGTTEGRPTALVDGEPPAQEKPKKRRGRPKKVAGMPFADHNEGVSGEMLTRWEKRFEEAGLMEAPPTGVPEDVDLACARHPGCLVVWRNGNVCRFRHPAQAAIAVGHNVPYEFHADDLPRHVERLMAAGIATHVCEPATEPINAPPDSSWVVPPQKEEASADAPSLYDALESVEADPC